MNKGYSIQLWSVRDRMADADNYIKTLKNLKSMGYSGVEFAGYGGLDAKAMKKELQRIGLRAPATHLGIDNFKGELLKTNLEYAAEVGIKYMIAPCISFKNYDEVLECAEVLNAAGDEAKKYGIFTGFHNHGYEYVADNGEYSVDYLMRETNPETVVLEEDIFWTEYAGINHIDFLMRNAKRCKLIHLKQKGEKGENAEIPRGIFDIKKVIATAKDLGIDEFVVEQEEYTVDSLTSAKEDIDYLLSL